VKRPLPMLLPHTFDASWLPFTRAQMAIGFERVAKIRAGQGHQRASVDLF